MTLPPALVAALRERLGAVLSAHPVGGGSISRAVRLEIARAQVFLKYDPRAPAGLFAAEAQGLRELRAAAGELRVPEVLALSDPEEEGGAPALGWLALEWLEPGGRTAAYSERLGRGLARLHGAAPAGGWGWSRDGYIGTLAQSNRPAGGWASFWSERRLEPQLRLARAAGLLPGGEGEWERLFERLPGLLAPAEGEGPSLLHGDLWGGNAMPVADGEPAVYDPAAYHGHAEVDLAMSELFGGFDAAFYAAYRELRPLAPGYAEARRAVYQLYYLLVHLNLFGAGYRAQTARVLRQALAAG